LAFALLLAVGLRVEQPTERWQRLLRALGFLGAACVVAIALVAVSGWVLTILPNDGLFHRLFLSGARMFGDSDWLWLMGVALPLYALAAFSCYWFQRQQASVTEPSGEIARKAAVAGMTLFSAFAFPLLTYLVTAEMTNHVGPPKAESANALGLTQPVRAVLYLVPWMGVVAAGYLVRNFLIQYVGDVAAYVASHKLDRFNEVRTKIRETADMVFRTVYLQEKAGIPYYRQVAVVAHSLGSVIAYDALNALLLEEALNPGMNLDALQRTTLLLTMGSPLDKVAYVYSTLSTDTDLTREILAGAAKPLISDPRARANLAWVNFWSPNDVISGRLDYFDGLPVPAVGPIINVRDPDATTPIVAHGEYFEHPLMYGLIAAWHML
jgi:hypothetical protein